jgi:hypothetical protein
MDAEKFDRIYGRIMHPDAESDIPAQEERDAFDVLFRHDPQAAAHFARGNVIAAALYLGETSTSTWGTAQVFFWGVKWYRAKRAVVFAEPVPENAPHESLARAAMAAQGYELPRQWLTLVEHGLITGFVANEVLIRAAEGRSLSAPLEVMLYAAALFDAKASV